MGNTLTRTHDLIAGVRERQLLEREVISAAKAARYSLGKLTTLAPSLGLELGSDLIDLHRKIDALNKLEAERAGVEGVHE